MKKKIYSGIGGLLGYLSYETLKVVYEFTFDTIKQLYKLANLNFTYESFPEWLLPIFVISGLTIGYLYGVKHDYDNKEW